jgi:hypothetical protein
MGVTGTAELRTLVAERMAPTGGHLATPINPIDTARILAAMG